MAENIFASYSTMPVPKNETDYEILLGGVLGASLEIVPLAMREKFIRIITKKYQYHKHEHELRKKKGVYSHVARILSDVCRYRHLCVYMERPLKLKEKKSLRKAKTGTKYAKPLSMRKNSLKNDSFLQKSLGIPSS